MEKKYCKNCEHSGVKYLSLTETKFMCYYTIDTIDNITGLVVENPPIGGTHWSEYHLKLNKNNDCIYFEQKVSKSMFKRILKLFKKNK